MNHARNTSLLFRLILAPCVFMASCQHKAQQLGPDEVSSRGSSVRQNDTITLTKSVVHPPTKPIKVSPEIHNHAIGVISNFETGSYRNGYGNLSKNEGISCGIMQWNIQNSSSLPSWVAKYRRQNGDEVMRNLFGNNFDDFIAANSTGITADARVTAATSWWAENPKMLKSIENFMLLPEVVKFQRDDACDKGNLGYADATAWLSYFESRRFAGTPTEPHVVEYTLFTDAKVFARGGLSQQQVSTRSLEALIARHGSIDAAVNSALSEWEKNIPEWGFQAPEATKNARLWRGSLQEMSDYRRALFLVAYIRAANANTIYRNVLLSRLGSVIIGEGWVNGKRLTPLDAW